MDLDSRNLHRVLVRSSQKWRRSRGVVLSGLWLGRCDYTEENQGVDFWVGLQAQGPLWHFWLEDSSSDLPYASLSKL